MSSVPQQRDFTIVLIEILPITNHPRPLEENQRRHFIKQEIQDITGDHHVRLKKEKKEVYYMILILISTTRKAVQNADL